MKTKLSISRSLTCIAFLLFSTLLAAQDNFLADSSQIEIGLDLRQGKKIMAKVYHFKERIQDVEFDPKRANVLITFRPLSRNGKWLKNKGSMSLYSVNFGQLNWSEDIKFNQSNFSLYENMLLQRSSRGSYAFNKQNGEELWDVKNSLFYLIEEENIGFGYTTSTDVRKHGILSGYDLKEGRKKWNRTLSPTYGWNEVLTLNDTSLLISASGLFALNPKTGNGWEYQVETGSKDHTAAVVGTGLGLIAGALTGTYGVVRGANIVHQLASNVLIDSSELYFASKEKLTKLNTAGEVLWEIELDKKETSKSKLFLSANSLFSINYGFAYQGSKKKQYGRAYIACYNPTNGELHYSTYLSDDENKYISDWKQSQQQILFSFEEALLLFSAQSGKAIKKYQLDQSDYGKFLFFIDDNVLIEHDSTFISLNSLSEQNHYLYTDQNIILEIDSTLAVVNQYNLEELYVSFLTEGDKQFIIKDGESLIIDNSGMPIAKLKVSKNAVLIDKTLVEKKGKKLYTIDLSTILSSSQR